MQYTHFDNCISKNEFYLYFCRQNEKTEKGEGETKSSKNDVPDSIYYMKQFISNACGTIALVHSVANNLDK